MTRVPRSNEVSRWRFIPKVSYTNFRKAYPNIGRACFGRWFGVERRWSSRIINIYVRHHQLSLDFRRDWLADFVQPRQSALCGTHDIESIELAFFNHDGNGSESQPGQWEKRRDSWRSFKSYLATHRTVARAERLTTREGVGGGGLCLCGTSPFCKEVLKEGWTCARSFVGRRDYEAEPKDMAGDYLVDLTLQVYARSCHPQCSRGLHERAFRLVDELKQRVAEAKPPRSELVEEWEAELTRVRGLIKTHAPYGGALYQMAHARAGAIYEMLASLRRHSYTDAISDGGKDQR